MRPIRPVVGAGAPPRPSKAQMASAALRWRTHGGSHGRRVLARYVLRRRVLRQSVLRRRVVCRSGLRHRFRCLCGGFRNRRKGRGRCGLLCSGRRLQLCDLLFGCDRLTLGRQFRRRDRLRAVERLLFGRPRFGSFAAVVGGRRNLRRNFSGGCVGWLDLGGLPIVDDSSRLLQGPLHNHLDRQRGGNHKILRDRPRRPDQKRKMQEGHRHDRAGPKPARCHGSDLVRCEKLDRMVTFGAQRAAAGPSGGALRAPAALANERDLEAIRRAASWSITATTSP